MLDLDEIKGLDPDVILLAAARAVYFGYSIEAFQLYAERLRIQAVGCPEHLLPDEGPFLGTGYIPTLEDRADPAAAIAEINQRRICDEPFGTVEEDPDLSWLLDEPILERYLRCLL